MTDTPSRDRGEPLELTADQLACLLSAPHILSPYTNCAFGTPGAATMELARMGLLAPHPLSGAFGSTRYERTQEGAEAARAAENAAINLRNLLKRPRPPFPPL